MKGFAVIALFTLAACAHAQRCPAQQADDWTIERLLPHRDCTKFYQCTHGKRVEQSCPFGLRYNIVSQLCDYPANVKCGNRYVPRALKSPIVVPELENNPGSGGEKPIVVPEVEGQPRPEEGADRPIVVPGGETEEEEEVVIEESDEVAVEKSDEVVVEVDSEEAVEEDDKPVVTPEPEGENSVEEISFLPNGCPEDFSVHWLVANENDCTKFYNCNNGEKVEQSCSGRLHFNAELQVCDYPEQAGCVKSFSKHSTSRKSLINKSRM